jgi:hypothetical protein
MAKAPLILTGLALAALWGASHAAAATPPPPVPNNPALQQYVEAVPTSRGPVLARGGSPLPATLTPKVVAQVASSPRYGAPEKRLHASARVARSERQAARKPPAAVSASSLGAAVDAVGAGHGVVVWLVVALLATSAVGVGAAIRRARR